MKQELKRVLVFEGSGAVVFYELLKVLRGLSSRPVRVIVESIDRPGEGLLKPGVEIRSE